MTDDLEKRFDHLTARVDVLSERVDHLTARVDVLNERVDHLTARVDQLSERIDLTNARLNRVIDALGEVGVALAALHQGQIALERRQDALERRQEALERGQIMIVERLDRLGEVITQGFASHGIQLAAIHDRVGRLEQEIRGGGSQHA